MLQTSTHKYLISAVVSTYNGERFMRGKLEDLETQSIADHLEIIVIDSGSEQNERHIVEDFQLRYRNIRYLRTEQRETIYQAWNRGITLASGEFICNANIDDRLRQDALEVMVRTLQENQDCALVYPDILYTTQENSTFADFALSGQIRFPSYKRFSLLEGCNIQTAPVWRRKLHAEFGCFNERYRSAADYEFWLRVSERYEMLHVNQFLVLGLQRQESISSSLLAYFEFLQIQSKYRLKFAHLLPKAEALPECEQKVFLAGTSRSVAASEREAFLMCYPDYPPAHHLLGELYFTSEEFALAKWHFEKAVLLDPYCQSFQDSLTGFFRIRCLPILMQLAQKAQADPTDLESRLCAGMLCFFLNRPQQARQYYREALELAPENILARLNVDI